MTLVVTTDSARTASWKQKITDCVYNMKLTGSDMKDVIDTHYSELENWQNPPNIALRLGLQKVCQVKY